MARKRRVPPSRVRYEQHNPTVSVRVSREMYDRLKALRERSGKSLGDILREALGVQEPATRAAYSRGHRKGYADAEKLYPVDYRCSVCNGRLTIDDDTSKGAAAKYMRENGWAHSSCHQQAR